jgi:hypothetical protein
MNKQPQILTAATAITLLAIGGTATASDIDQIRYVDEINNCVAEIAVHANYDDASRVLHTVITENRSRLGYTFSIDTSVFGDDDQEAIRKYASYCVARGENTVLKFTIDEVSG